MRSTLSLRLLVMLGVMFGIASTAVAQNFRILDPGPGERKAPHDPPPFTHWDLREMPNCQVPWVMGTAPVIDLNNNLIPNEPADRALAQGVFAAALSRWDAVLPSDLGFVNTGAAPPYGGFVLDGYNTIIFDSTTLPQTLIAQVFTTSSASTGRIIEADIIFNSDTAPIPPYGVRHFVMQAPGSPLAADLDYPPYYNWPTPADGDTDLDGDFIQEHDVDLLNIAMHECGHFVGLGHIEPLGGAMNNPANALMEQYWTFFLGPLGGGWANQTLKLPDRDGENFLYTPDLGDAPDPWMGVAGQYPTIVHRPGLGRHLNGLTLDLPGPGAEHILAIKPRQPARNWTYEWLGRLDNSNVDGECEANTVDLDPLDDGVTYYPNPPIWGRTLTVTAWVRTANDNLGNSHNYLTTPLWANSWIDLNQDGVWSPFFPEWFMNNPVTPAPLVGPNTVGVGGITSSVLLPAYVPYFNLPVWMRTRLDWGEDVGLAANVDSSLYYSAGAAQFGEVEDYPLWCNRRYEQHWVQYNQFLTNVQGIRNVYAGIIDAGDQVWGGEVDANCCIVQSASSVLTVYGGPDETTHDFVMPFFLNYGQRMSAGKCRSSTTLPPITLARAYWLSNEFTVGIPSPPPAEIPDPNRIPSVNVGYCLGGPTAAPTSMLVRVGAVDVLNGGYLTKVLTAASDRETMASPGGWNDTLRVNVSYRVTPSVLPLASLSPCDPLFATLTEHVVGSGSVTPEDGLTFPLSIPGNVAPGQSVIVEVESRWSTNSTVNSQLVEFPLPLGGATPIEDTPAPKRLVLESYPNPFNPSTTIRFALPNAETVSLAVYDVTGRLVRTLLHDAKKPAGFFEAQWDGTDASGKPAASGVYFFRLTTSKETLTRKAVLLK